MYPVYNVLAENPNLSTIKPYNVFNHYSFANEVAELVKNLDARNLSEFEERLDNIARYYFWGKYEWEIGLTEVFPKIGVNQAKLLVKEYANGPKSLYYVDLYCHSKIDVYSQLHLNWDRFVDYCENLMEEDFIVDEGDKSEND